jgi:hypothetical protein
MSTSGADYPEGVNVGSGKINDLAAAQRSPPPVTLSPQQLLIPKNSSSIQESSPTNTTGSNHPISKPQSSSNVDINLEALIYGALAIVLMIIVSAVVLTYKRKGKFQTAI